MLKLCVQSILNYGHNMQIVIPMTGHGSRFVTEGYTRLKPFIKIHDVPMIQWVTTMFPGNEGNILYICRDEHLQTKKYVKKELTLAAPDASIFQIKDWVKQGPVSDVLRASEVIEDDQPVLVSYCDFFASWDFKKFKQYIKANDPDGAVPCYTGFHPHLIHKDNVYATCETNNSYKLKKITEKFQLNKSKFMDLQSPGLYYFKSGKLMKEYCRRLMKSKESINGEYYMSLPFNGMTADGLNVLCPPVVDYFCQWGTPKDLSEYNYWMNIAKSIDQTS